jgi:hypothetical protein
VFEVAATKRTTRRWVVWRVGRKRRRRRRNVIRIRTMAARTMKKRRRKE